MWQETAIIIIGILTAGYTGWKVVRFFKPSKKEVPFCAGCSSHCPLKK
ncbi:MAG: FeoB-associated Cys-rich membrane protein [Prevotellaceae bacterium]|jgi:hypothetical protein|nr:FeoB-associated Cys-rich membrane protein [Prevotellaceae bacterium]